MVKFQIVLPSYDPQWAPYIAIVIAEARRRGWNCFMPLRWSHRRNDDGTFTVDGEFQATENSPFNTENWSVADGKRSLAPIRPPPLR